MLRERSDLWKRHKQGHWICITTNAEVTAKGNTMGAGNAKAAALLYPWLRKKLGDYIKQYGNRVFQFTSIRLITFPTKHDWRNDSDLDLIEQSARQLVILCDKFGIEGPIYIPSPGIGNGNLRWEDVEARIAPILDDRFVILYQ